jgi:hypothetical protein
MGLCASTTKVRINENNSDEGGNGNTNVNLENGANNINDTQQSNSNRYFFSEMGSQSLAQKKINKAVDQILPTVRSIIMKK